MADPYNPYVTVLCRIKREVDHTCQRKLARALQMHAAIVRLALARPAGSGFDVWALSMLLGGFVVAGSLLVLLM
jgi:hypothetical protein